MEQEIKRFASRGFSFMPRDAIFNNTSAPEKSFWGSSFYLYFVLDSAVSKTPFFSTPYGGRQHKGSPIPDDFLIWTS